MMRRLRRMLINALTILSLLLCVATCVQWARSRGVMNIISYTSYRDNHGRRWGFTSSNDTFALWADDYGKGPAGPGFRTGLGGGRLEIDRGMDLIANEASGENERIVFRGLGFAVLKNQPSLLFRAWSLIVLTSILPILAIIGYQRRRLIIRSGQCPTCGYDLRATPDRCPECGDVPAAKGIA